MNKSVGDIISDYGGVDAIAEASQSTRNPVSASAVHKWRRNGIPDEHWSIFIASGVSVETIFRANEVIRNAKLDEKVEAA